MCIIRRSAGRYIYFSGRVITALTALHSEDVHYDYFGDL